MEESERLPLSTRLALRPKVAAEALGVCERTLRGLLPQIPHTRIGNAVLIPVEGLQAWLRDQAKAEGSRAERIAGEILRAVSGSGED